MLNYKSLLSFELCLQRFLSHFIQSAITIWWTREILKQGGDFMESSEGKRET